MSAPLVYVKLQYIECYAQRALLVVRYASRFISRFIEKLKLIYTFKSGYTQNATIFRGRIAAIRKQCSSGTTFKFLDPPHIVQSVNLPQGSLVQYDSTANSENEEESPRAWWFAKELVDNKNGRRYEGIDDTWHLLKETLEKERFDVVLGFSQGIRSL